ETLPAMGLVESQNSRFNTFVCTDEGRELLLAALDERPYNRSVDDHLVLWVRGGEEGVQTGALRRALSPLEPLNSRARTLLRDKLLRKRAEESDDAVRRRRDALAWVEAQRAGRTSGASWSQRPPEIAEAHWTDLLAGARFFAVRDAALAVLNVLECQMPAERSLTLNEKAVKPITKHLADLRGAAQAFLDIRHEDELANTFCRECTHTDPIQLLEKLIPRDDRVLRLQGARICPGPAFRGGTQTHEEQRDTDPDTPIIPDARGFPEGISHRIHNLFLFNVDLQGELSSFLVSEGEAEDRL
ncbi:hypothetical protein LRB11_16005, partial [Ectothiorhodospira haloalkaliphila]|uniref:hypothetical protein n=1 Tax=Ectothiorhodospira haloalkaliphila TaxID=421628 RepID=UPI001EE96BCB